MGNEKKLQTNAGSIVLTMQVCLHHEKNDKFHTRLRFCQQDLIAMANAGKDDNGSQFFFSFSSTPTLLNKHTLFGKVTAETIYNMLKLEEALVDENDRSLCHPRLIKTIILNNPFSNIIPRIIVQESEEVKDSSKTETAAVKDFNLLSFGEEAEEDEEESVILNKKFSRRISYKITFLSTRFNCCGRDDNGSQFFFTLCSTSELQNKRTIFGKVTGETIYNMLKLKETLVDVNDRPLYAPKMIKAELLNYPFSDIIPRIIVQESEEVKDSSKTKTGGVKNISLLSLGQKAEEHEEESAILNKKSSADEPPELANKKRKEERISDWELLGNNWEINKLCNFCD
ncbi:Peptidyl-prolyl cis-trans isomerase CWC27 like protein [Eufriesea mexicana]|nr:Peptidyl-prolyl cis-trans isomerase CWC27 like protein [Eufriesea mexicana]